MGAYKLVEYYPTMRSIRYVGDHPTRAASRIFPHIERLLNDAEGAIKPILYKQRLQLSIVVRDDSYIAWRVFELVIKTSIDSLRIEGSQDPALNGSRNDQPAGF